MAGGAYVSAQSVLVYTDIWSLNAQTDAYNKYPTTLPTPTYHGTSQLVNKNLYIWGGLTNTVGAGSFHTYNSQFIQVNFNTNPPTVLNRALTGVPVQGTQYPSSVMLGNDMYIWGGTAGTVGTSTLPNQQWFSINIQTAVVTIRNQSCIPDPINHICDYPSSVYVSPILFTSSAGRYIYLYSGMQADFATWNNPFDVFIYDAVAGWWLEDVEPYISPFSGLTPQMPNMAMGGITSSLDGNHWIIVGGSEGDVSPNGAGSHNKIFHIDATPMINNGGTGRPVITILSATLPNNLESPVVGLTKQNNELIVWGGVSYFNSELAYPSAYYGNLYEIIQAGYEPSPSSAGSTINNNSSLSGGQIAGIIVGSILGTALIMVCFFMFITGRWGSGGGARGGGGGWAKHSDAGSELSTRV